MAKSLPPKLDYSIQSHGWRKNAGRFSLICVVILGVVMGIKTWNSRFRSVSICGNTGEMLQQTEWYIPFTNTRSWTSQSISDTPISIVIKRYGLASSTSHNWLFSQGSGNGVMCAVGDGSHVINAATSQFVADFIDCACRCDEKQFATEWVKLLLDPHMDASNTARLAIGVANMPSGFFDRAAFEKCWTDNSSGAVEYLNAPVPKLDKSQPASSRPSL